MAMTSGNYARYEELLDKAGKSTYEVCKATEIEPSTISNWKSGNYTPKIDKIAKLAEYFDVPVTFFYK